MTRRALRYLPFHTIRTTRTRTFFSFVAAKQNNNNILQWRFLISLLEVVKEHLQFDDWSLLDEQHRSQIRTSGFALGGVFWIRLLNLVSNVVEIHRFLWVILFLRSRVAVELLIKLFPNIQAGFCQNTSPLLCVV